MAVSSLWLTLARKGIYRKEMVAGNRNVGEPSLSGKKKMWSCFLAHRNEKARDF